ncbi:MAG: DUF4124 domain-containing protein [Pseudomonadales bacterium]|nr:DUF4124 domain-containing protein [Gammaproteobacteria bacterium]NNL56948.1 DUF4124 domain-containing protein [Pseudomonadales bacterium]
MQHRVLATLLPSASTSRWLGYACLCSSLLLGSLASHAETYFKWINDNGSWEYGAHPPPGKQAIEIKTSVTKALQKSQATANGEGASGKSTLEMEFEEKQKATRKRNTEYCATARSNLEALSSKAVIRRRDAEGNVTVVSEQERNEEIGKAEVAIERYCG